MAFSSPQNIPEPPIGFKKWPSFRIVDTPDYSDPKTRFRAFLIFDEIFAASKRREFIQIAHLPISKTAKPMIVSTVSLVQFLDDQSTTFIAELHRSLQRRRFRQLYCLDFKFEEMTESKVLHYIKRYNIPPKYTGFRFSKSALIDLFLEGRFQLRYMPKQFLSIPVLTKWFDSLPYVSPQLFKEPKFDPSFLVERTPENEIRWLKLFSKPFQHFDCLDLLVAQPNAVWIQFLRHSQTSDRAKLFSQIPAEIRTIDFLLELSSATKLYLDFYTDVEIDKVTSVFSTEVGGEELVPAELAALAPPFFQKRSKSKSLLLAPPPALPPAPALLGGLLKVSLDVLHESEKVGEEFTNEVFTGDVLETLVTEMLDMGDEF